MLLHYHSLKARQSILKTVGECRVSYRLWAQSMNGRKLFTLQIIHDLLDMLYLTWS